MKKFLIKIKDYFTANSCRKIFFFSALLSIIFFIGALIVRDGTVGRLGVGLAVLATAVSFVDTILSRKEFLRQIQEMQYEHLQETIWAQEKDPTIPMTPTFSAEERKYLRRRKSGFLVSLVLKATFLFCFILLLF